MASAQGRRLRETGCVVVVAAAGYGKTTMLETTAARGTGVYLLGPDLAARPPVDGLLDLPAGSATELAIDEVSALTLTTRELLARSLTRLPSHVRVMLAARRPLEPSVMAALPGPVITRGPAGLALAPHDVARVLRDEHGVVDSDAAYLVHALTSGWPALVHFGGDAIAAQGAGRKDLLAALTEPGTPCAAWVEEQVLRELPLEEARVLDAIADLDPISEPLCAQLASRPHPSLSPQRTVDALRRLVAAGLVVAAPVPAGGDASPTLRMVPVVREVLRGQGHRAGTAAPHGATLSAPKPHQVAASWYESHGYPLAAARVLAGAGETRGCLRLIESRGDQMLAAGGAAEVAALIEAVPPAERTPPVGLIHADSLRMAGDAAGAAAAFAPLLAEAERSGRWPARLCWRAAMLSYMRGDYRGALDLLERAGAAVDSGAPTADDALVLACRATVLVVLGQTGDAATAATDSLSAASSAGDDAALAAAHIAAAHIAVGVRRDEHLAKALAAAERAGDIVSQARVLANQADCLLRDAKYPQALQEATRAVRTAELGAPPGVLVTALHNAGEALTRLGRYDEATLHFERSIQLSHRAGLSRTAPGLYGLGEVNRQLGRREQSRVAFEEAAELARSHAEAQILVPALAGLARLLADGSDPVAARAAADEAETVAPPALAATALIARGWVALAEGDLALARRRADDAVGAARASRQADAMAEALELAAAACSSTGQARTALTEAAAIWHRAGAVPAEDRLLVLLGRLPDADGRQRWAARAATKRLAELGVWMADGSTPHPADASAPVRVRVLGRFEVLVAGAVVPLPAWRSRQARTLLKILVARRGRPVPRAELCELLWPDDEPQRTAHRLSVLLSVVRAVLDPNRVRPADYYLPADLAGVRLDVARASIDVEDLLRDAAHGLQLAAAGHAERAREILTDVDLAYGGDAFEDEPYEDWACALREEARAIWLRGLRELAELCRRAGDLDQSATVLVRLLAADGLDESAHQALVRVLLEAGRHGEARRAFSRWTQAMRSIEAPAPDPAILRDHPVRRELAVPARAQHG